MIIEFEEKDHIYTVNGEIASISVTELLAKHGLAPNYNGANKELLKEASLKGKEVHKDLENVLNTYGYKPTTPQGEHFAQWVSKNLDCGVGEQPLAYEYNGLIIAGTADVMGILKSGEYTVSDHKNTAKFHREYVSWQVSLLDYFARKLENESINGKPLIWKGATKFYCFHYEPKTGDMTTYELEKVTDVEIEKLIQAEYEGKIYHRAELSIEPELQEKFIQAENVLAQVEMEYKQAEANAKALREQLCAIFAEQGIKSWESPSGLKVTYVEPIDRLSVDSKKLKNEYPEAFKNCQKLSKVKASVRITIKEQDNENL